MPVKKQLLLLRHAKAEGIAPKKADIDRRLLPATRSCSPDRKLYSKHDWYPRSNSLQSSPTSPTNLKELDLSPTNIKIEPTLYGAFGSTLLQRIEEQSNAITTILLIAHNPSISQLASRLAGNLPRRSAHLRTRTPRNQHYLLDGGFRSIHHPPRSFQCKKEDKTSKN